MPCGFDIARSRSELAALTERPEWKRLEAVKNKEVFVTDGNQFFNRPGPRLVESAEILAEILHPDAFAFAPRGRGMGASRTGRGLIFTGTSDEREQLGDSP